MHVVDFTYFIMPVKNYAQLRTPDGRMKKHFYQHKNIKILIDCLIEMPV